MRVCTLLEDWYEQGIRRRRLQSQRVYNPLQGHQQLQMEHIQAKDVQTQVLEVAVLMRMNRGTPSHITGAPFLHLYTKFVCRSGKQRGIAKKLSLKQT